MKNIFLIFLVFTDQTQAISVINRTITHLKHAKRLYNQNRIVKFTNDQFAQGEMEKYIKFYKLDLNSMSREQQRAFGKYKNAVCATNFKVVTMGALSVLAGQIALLGLEGMLNIAEKAKRHTLNMPIAHSAVLGAHYNQWTIN